MRKHILSITFLLVFAGMATAGSFAQESLALGYQAEHADLVAMGSFVSAEADPAGNFRVTFSVTETIRGDVTTGTSVRVDYANLGHRPPWRRGLPHLLFLMRRKDTDRWTTVSGPASIRAIPREGTITRLPGLTKEYVATLPAEGRAADPEELRTLLTGWMADPEPGVAWSAAMDFVRRRDLHEGLTDQERARVLAAFVGHPYGKASKDALALAVAAARPSGAGDALVTALTAEHGRTIRVTVADALRELSDPKVPSTIAAKLSGASPRAQADLLQVLGHVGGAESVDVARKYVTSKTAEVRWEAAHALGRIARTVREEKSDAVVRGTTDLEGMLAASPDERSQQAALWALAQLQDPEAVTLLTKLAKEDEREFVRTWAKRYRDRPRLSLILR